MKDTLSTKYIPRIVSLSLPCDEAAIIEVDAELRKKARADEFKCFGYFPGMQAKAADLEFDLPMCKKFAELVPELTVNDKKTTFGFLRMSLIEQVGISPYHVDSDASAALGGDIAGVSDKHIWRLLLNMSNTHQRTLSYLNINPMTVKLVNKNGYIHYPSASIDQERMQYISIPPRDGVNVTGVLFCASRVLHAGKDDKFGHFVAGYGCEV